MAPQDPGDPRSCPHRLVAEGPQPLASTQHSAENWLPAGMCSLNKINARKQEQNPPLMLQGRCLIQRFRPFSILFLACFSIFR